VQPAGAAGATVCNQKIERTQSWARSRAQADAGASLAARAACTTATCAKATIAAVPAD